MKQEIQVATRTPALTDYWTQGQSAVGTSSGASGAPAQSPLKRIHRLLRGRYPLALFLVMAGGLAGAMAGFVLLEPKYESDGLVQVDPAVFNGGDAETVLPMIGMKMQSITTVITSARVAEDAVQDPKFIAAWKKAYPGSDVMAPADFMLALDAEHEKNSFNIKVTFVDKNKDVAQAGTRAAISAYMDKFGDTGGTMRQKEMDFDDASRTKAEDDLKKQRADLAKLGEAYASTDLTQLRTNAQAELARLQTVRDNAEQMLESAKAAKTAPPTTPPDREVMIQAIAAQDHVMQMKVLQRDNDQKTADDMKYVYGTNFPRYQGALNKVSEDNVGIDKYLQDYQIRTAGRPLPGVLDGTASISVEAAQQAVDQSQRDFDRQMKRSAEIQKVFNDIGDVNARIQADMDTVQSETGKITRLEAEQALTKNVAVLDYGPEAQLSGNKRPIAAIAGFVFGGAFPLGLLMLYGLVDHRFRYSDDAMHADLGGVALLGILPNLPDRLSDPQQAGIAAHCVHQIRTMLQISRNNDEPQILAVTSAAPADGKTSLTLALGLSYAACGARTLLIDCDLIGAGLSHRLNVHAPEGMLEAVANRALLEYVLTTDIADVALLPVGTAHAHHASTLSPVALRRLLSEAKKHFDIVLVDTGPILGSIEASLVCAAADRTILTVARGQQRPLVERSIGHLQAIGARLAGVVFNRAQPRDFERSLSGLALRSRPMNGNGATVAGPSAAGPVVTPGKATPGSFKRAV